jgi:hypothetical protein
MSEIYVIWADDADKAQARLEQITDGESYRVIRRGDFTLIQAEDLSANRSLISDGDRYCIVLEVR